MRLCTHCIISLHQLWSSNVKQSFYYWPLSYHLYCPKVGVSLCETKSCMSWHCLSVIGVCWWHFTMHVVTKHSYIRIVLSAFLDWMFAGVLRFEEQIEALKLAEKDFHSRMPRYVRLMIAITEALMSRTDLLCYFVMVLNVLLSASVLSILFPISIFFWGMLSVPRPTKTYWITVITYTEVDFGLILS